MRMDIGIDTAKFHTFPNYIPHSYLHEFGHYFLLELTVSFHTSSYHTSPYHIPQSHFVHPQTTMLVPLLWSSTCFCVQPPPTPRLHRQRQHCWTISLQDKNNLYIIYQCLLALPVRISLKKTDHDLACHHYIIEDQ